MKHFFSGGVILICFTLKDVLHTFYRLVRNEFRNTQNTIRVCRIPFDFCTLLTTVVTLIHTKLRSAVVTYSRHRDRDSPLTAQQSVITSSRVVSFHCLLDDSPSQDLTRKFKVYYAANCLGSLGRTVLARSSI